MATTTPPPATLRRSASRSRCRNRNRLIPPRPFAVTVADQTYTEGEAISPLTFPAASGGNGTLSYSLTPTVPGLTFAAATRTLSGAPTSAGTYAMTYQAVDGDDNTAASDAATLSFTITVQEPEPPDTAPAFRRHGGRSDLHGRRGNQPADVPRGQRRQRHLVLLPGTHGAGADVRRGHTHAERHADLCRYLRHDVPGGRWRRQHRRQRCGLAPLHDHGAGTGTA